ncbi:MAG: hypothetical protein KJ060_16300 [Candidatus Hydrogenedentes bacterium]|nr:hypothetical protein [Candidatus Hydrogenedentota bacterium]
MWRVAFLAAIAPIIAAPAFAGSSQLDFTSDPGSWIGQGEAVSASLASGFSFVASEPLTGGIQVVIENAVPVFEPEYRYWILMIEGPDGDALAVGSYLDAERYAFASPGHPGLDFTGNFRGANTLTGNFTVEELEYDGGGDLSRLVVEFTQYEDGDTSKGVYGRLVYDASADEPSDLPGLSPFGLCSLAVAIVLAGLSPLRVLKMRRLTVHS